jgi:deoxyribodipyrimidine photo-lyase
MSKTKQKINIFWFRRDLRLHDNHGLYQALKSDLPVLPIFIFDQNILDKLPNNDHRVEFIHSALNEINEKLKPYGGSLRVFHSDPIKAFKIMVEEYDLEGVYTNHDYEPYAKIRDDSVSELLKKNGVTFYTFKDQVLFEKDEVVKDDGKPYTVYTPYSKKWKSHLNNVTIKDIPSYSSEKKLEAMLKAKYPLPSLEKLGFVPSELRAPGKSVKKDILVHYREKRDFPALESTSKLGVHLRFGTVSPRDCIRKAIELKSETWLSELIWREFFMQILWHFPNVINGPFKEKYSKIQWRNNTKEFEAWCQGQTGYPIVDAGMRELNQTGFMHNRVRMITASFLIKHLLIDWRWGEKYFAEKLFDFDLSANNGNWQWVAGCGCDGAPYFRIFNPDSQTEKFDNKFEYIRKWVPEYQSKNYPERIVEHTFARNRCLKAFEVVK